MSHLVNLSDEAYEELSKLKQAKQASYSEVIIEILDQAKHTQKTLTTDDIISRIKERDKSFKGKKEKIDHDLIAYGVSRDSS